MHNESFEHKIACEACRSGAALGFDFTMAFQPIVDVETRTVFAYEALVRGTDGAGAFSILERVTQDNRYRFDQACRSKAVELASSLGMESKLSINFLPNAVYEPAVCIQATLAAAKRYDFPVKQIMFEVAESEQMVDQKHVKRILQDYQGRGFTTAIDDFGAGYAGLSLLVDFQPDVIKIDIALLREIDADGVRQSIVNGLIGICADLDIAIIAEGVETEAEYAWLRGRGLRYFQGYLFARPGLETLPDVAWPAS